MFYCIANFFSIVHLLLCLFLIKLFFLFLLLLSFPLFLFPIHPSLFSSLEVLVPFPPPSFFFLQLHDSTANTCSVLLLLICFSYVLFLILFEPLSPCSPYSTHFTQQDRTHFANQLCRWNNDTEMFH